jgi:hypothetical protein
MDRAGGKEALVEPSWVERMSGEARKVQLKLTQRALRSAPPFVFLTDLSPAYVPILRAHYGLPLNR